MTKSGGAAFAVCVPSLFSAPRPAVPTGAIEWGCGGGYLSNALCPHPVSVGSFPCSQSCSFFVFIHRFFLIAARRYFSVILFPNLSFRTLDSGQSILGSRPRKSFDVLKTSKKTMWRKLSRPASRRWCPFPRRSSRRFCAICDCPRRKVGRTPGRRSGATPPPRCRPV